jgi:hypothetical protein
VNLSGVRTGLKTALETIAGLNVYDYELELPNFPAAVVRMPEEIDPRAVLGGGNWTYTIPVMLLIARNSDRSADAQLEVFLDQTGSGSVVAALRVDPSLGGACMSADVAVVNNFGFLTFETVNVMSCTLAVEVMT